jgi:hypothetical protein
MIICGVDPGKTGAYCAISEQGTIIAYEVFTDWTAFANFMLLHKPDMRLCGLEKPHAAPAAGRVASWNFAEHCGGYKSLLEYLKIPHVSVDPASWQPKILGKFNKGESKKASVEYINRRYPELNLKQKDHGISDSICISLFTSKFK